MTVFPFDPAAHARRTDPDTSHAAARKLRVGTQLWETLRAFRDAGPMTNDEVTAYLGFDAARHGPWQRVSDLTNLGHIADTGERRPGLSRRMQMVRAITPRGRMVLEEGENRT